jgi:hypothetical protein
MDENRSPDAQFNFMHQIWEQHLEKVEAQGRQSV